MITLAIETSTTTGSLALFFGKELRAHKDWTREGSHSEFIADELSDLLKVANISVNQIQRLAVGIGPGSFTGIRVGINFARGLGYSLKIPVFTLNSLELLASQARKASPSTKVCVAQFAFRNLLYTATYQLDQSQAYAQMSEVLKPSARLASEILTTITEPTLLVGSGAPFLLAESSPATKKNWLRSDKISDVPFASHFAFTPALDQSPASLSDWIHTIPLYVRASEAEEKLRNSKLS